MVSPNVSRIIQEAKTLTLAERRQLRPNLMDFDAIILSGAPGVGKSTVANALRERFAWPVIELGFLRMLYLDTHWKTANAAEGQMSFEIMCDMVHRFVRHGFKNTILVDLLPEHIQQLDARLAGLEHLTVALTVTDPDEHRRRILEPTRDSGYRNIELAWAWNTEILASPRRAREVLLDTAADTVPRTVQRVMQTLQAWPPAKSLTAIP